MEGLKILAVEVSSDAAANVIETALNAGKTHGIGYWASVTDVQYFGIDEPKVDRVFSIKVFDAEGGGATDATPDSLYRLEGKRGRVLITVEHIKKAIGKMLEDPAATDAAGWIARIVNDDPDGPLADAIVQVACFGKVIYG